MTDFALMKSFLMLSISVGVVGLILYFVKRYTKKINQSIHQVELTVISKLTLGPKKELIIVKAENKILLLGSTDTNINVISDLTDYKNQPSVETPQNTANSDFGNIHHFSKFIENGVKSVNKSKETAKMETISNPSTAEETLSFKTFLRSTFSKN